MITFITILHLLFVVSLITFVLLQDSKGGASGMFGGGGGTSSVFGASGGSSFLVKATRFVAICFAITCLALTYHTSHKGGSITDNVLPPVSSDQAAPAAVAPATPEKADTQTEEAK